MEDSTILERMRADWNGRAGEDAYYYVAFNRREQGDEEFFATGSAIVTGLERELNRLQGREAALEIGCGPGRLMRPMSRHFGEIHGVDVSDEMIRMAEERLRDSPNAHLHRNSGSDLAMFPGEKFDFVYSYAVFQHIPSRDVVFSYLREAHRVLKPGGILRCQVNGVLLPTRQDDTWRGVRITEDEIARFAREQDLQLLAMEQIWTQYMWFTCRKRPAGWTASLAARTVPRTAVVRRVSNALTDEAVAPVSGPLAELSLWIAGLPDEVDLNHMALTADGRKCRPIYVGEREKDGIAEVKLALPEGVRTGMVPVELMWLGQPICETAWVRLIPAGPSVPHITAITDAINLASGTRVVNGLVKVTMQEVADATAFHATIEGLDVLDIESFCTDPVFRRYEFNFRLPARVAPGLHEVRVSLGKRNLAPLAIEVV